MRLLVLAVLVLLLTLRTAEARRLHGAPLVLARGEGVHDLFRSPADTGTRPSLRGLIVLSCILIERSLCVIQLLSAWPPPYPAQFRT